MYSVLRLVAPKIFRLPTLGEGAVRPNPTGLTQPEPAGPLSWLRQVAQKNVPICCSRQRDNPNPSDEPCLKRLPRA